MLSNDIKSIIPQIILEILQSIDTPDKRNILVVLWVKTVVRGNDS